MVEDSSSRVLGVSSGNFQELLKRYLDREQEKRKVETDGIDKLYRLSSGELEVLVISRKKPRRRGRAASISWLPCGKVQIGKVGGASDGFIFEMLSKFQREAGGDIEVHSLGEAGTSDQSVGILIDSGWIMLRGNRMVRVLQLGS